MERPTRQEVVHLFGLSGLAVAAPCLTLLQSDASILQAGDTEWYVLGGLVLLLLALPPALLLGLRLLAERLRPGAGRVVREVSVLLLLTLLALTLLNRLTFRAGPLVALGDAVLVAVVGWLAYRRFPGVRMFFTGLAVAAVALSATFLATTARLGPEAVTEMQGARQPVPVMWVVFDELPLHSLLDAEGRVDARDFPNFARLARRATLFRNATTVSSTTVVSVPAMLTGRYPEPGPAPAPSRENHPGTLFELLEDSARVEAREPVTALHRDAGDGEEEQDFLVAPFDLLPRLLEKYGEVVVPRGLRRERKVLDSRAQPSYDAEVDEFRKFLARIQGGRTPTVYFLHTVLPHGPWRFYPSGTRYRRSDDGHYRLSVGQHPWEALRSWQDHLMQVGFADRLLGELLDRLEQRGLYDRSLVIVTADHGLGFAPGMHGRSELLPAQVLPVPLLVKLPGQREGQVDDRAVETVDLLPTVLEVWGLEPPPGLDGRSFLGRAERDSRFFLTQEGQPLTFPPNLPGNEELRAWRDRTLAPDGRLASVLSLVPGERLLGRPLAGVKALPGTSVALEKPEAWNEVKPGSGYVPGLVRGSVSGVPAGVMGVGVAVAVDGVVRAQSVALGPPGQYVFSAVLPEGVLRAGRNRVEAVAVSLDPRVPADLVPPGSAGTSR